MLRWGRPRRSATVCATTARKTMRCLQSSGRSPAVTGSTLPAVCYSFFYPRFGGPQMSVAKRSSTAGRGSACETLKQPQAVPMLLANLTTGFCVVATGAHLATVAIAARRCRRPKRPIRPLSVPAISLLRPVCGDENFLAETLGSSFRLDHPDYEILFCAARQDDPAVPVVRRLLAANPEATAQPLIGGGGDA